VVVEKLRARLFGETEQSPRFYLSLFSYGAGYGAAGFGCVAAPFIAAVLFATTVGGALMGALAFLVYAVIVIVLMVALTITLSIVGDAAVKKLNKYTETIKKISAVVLIVAGIYLLYFFWSSTYGSATPVSVTTDGSHTVEYYATDAAGLVEATKSVAFRIDATRRSEMVGGLPG